MPKISRSTPVLPGSAAGILQQQLQPCDQTAVYISSSVADHNKCSTVNRPTPVLPGSAAGILQQQPQQSIWSAVWQQTKKLNDPLVKAQHVKQSCTHPAAAAAAVWNSQQRGHSTGNVAQRVAAAQEAA
jgi:hypothetical protein